MDDLNAVEQIVSIVVLGIVGTAVAALGLQAREWLKVNLGQSRWERVQSIIQAAVLAVEQEYGSEDGQAKKRYALQMVQKWLEEAGIVLDATTVSQLIEQVVLDEFNRWKGESIALETKTVEIDAVIEPA